MLDVFRFMVERLMLFAAVPVLISCKGFNAKPDVLKQQSKPFEGRRRIKTRCIQKPVANHEELLRFNVAVLNIHALGKAQILGIQWGVSTIKGHPAVRPGILAKRPVGDLLSGFQHEDLSSFDHLLFGPGIHDSFPGNHDMQMIPFPDALLTLLVRCALFNPAQRQIKIIRLAWKILV